MRLAPNGALRAQILHQPGYLASGHIKTLPPQLTAPLTFFT